MTSYQYSDLLAVSGTHEPAELVALQSVLPDSISVKLTPMPQDTADAYIDVAAVADGAAAAGDADDAAADSDGDEKKKNRIRLQCKGTETPKTRVYGFATSHRAYAHLRLDYSAEPMSRPRRRRDPKPRNIHVPRGASPRRRREP